MSLNLIRKGSSPSGQITRQPSLKSKRSPLGPSWVGVSAGAG
jgi:hypothetical protein